MDSGDSISRDEEWENRQLCSDGNCIGVIGPDGLCKECGRPGEGGATPVEAAEEASDAPAAEDPPEEADQPAREAIEETAIDDDDDWTNRRLCPDGNCIGVIGPDGRCKECGRRE